MTSPLATRLEQISLEWLQAMFGLPPGLIGCRHDRGDDGEIRVPGGWRGCLFAAVAEEQDTLFGVAAVARVDDACQQGVQHGQFDSLSLYLQVLAAAWHRGVDA